MIDRFKKNSDRCACGFRLGLAFLVFMLLSLQALAISATTYFPASGTSNICADTPLKITFDAAPTLGTTGLVKIFRASNNALVDTIDLSLNAVNGTQARTIGGTSYNTFPVLVSGNTAAIFPRAGVLAYNTAYYVTVDATVFSGFAGVSGTAAWTFTTKAAAPATSSTYVVVAADGTGDFCTVQGAVDWVPAANTTRRYINVRNGTYQEIIRVSAKHNLAFRGQHRKRTLVSYPNNNNINASTNTRALWNVLANDISFDGFTLWNTTPDGGSQAEALRLNGQRCVVNGCDLRSYQDTFLINTAGDTAYFRNSLIEGDADFIWGSGCAVFQSCEIKSLSSGYVCAMRNPAGQNGAVFLDCRFTRAAGVTNVYVARVDPNTYPSCSVAVVNCAMDAHITSAGWLLSATGPTTALRFWEYQSTDLVGAALNVSGRASFSSQINAATASTLRVLPTTFGGWTPVPPLPAFPGAEGAGMNTLGGRGGDVYYVTTLADSGVGSLRDALNTVPANGRTVLFKVSGTIALNSNLSASKRRVTIAGQSAPGGGICLKNYTLRLDADDVVVRHIRSRLGTDAAREDDAITIWGGINVMLDHCSASWSVDEVLSVTGESDNVTTQWCIVSEALDNSIHASGAHSFGSIVASYIPSRLSWHHNLYAHNQSRNPRPGSYNGITIGFDFRNNVLYDWGYFCGYSAASPEATDMNYVGNYLVKGPGSTTDSAFRGGDTTTRIFQSGNRIDLNKNGAFDGTDTGWAMFSGTYTQQAAAFDFSLPTTTDSANLALQRVLSQAGASPWARDSKDAAIAADVSAGTGGFVDSTVEAGGYPVLSAETPPVDSDNDGMPNYWEAAVGLNPAVADNNGDANGDGYTNLEEYLNWLAAPHVVTPTNTPVDVDLTLMNGGRTGLTYTLGSPTSGSVVLLADGRTARFTPTTAFNSMGSFAFSFTALGSTITQTVGVVVTPGIAANLTWVGTTGVWDIGATANFNDGTAASTFEQGDAVTFDQTGVTKNVTLTGVLAPGAVTVNASQDYTFTGTGSLSGAMPLTKSGTGKLTLGTANTFTGGTTVSGGTLALTNAAGAGAGLISLNASALHIGALNVTNPIGFTGANTVTGTGTGAKLAAMSGDGTVNLSMTSGVLDLGGDMRAFDGTLVISTNSTVRFNGSTGGSGATFDLGPGTGNMSIRTSATAIAMGGLQGGAGTILRGQSNGNATATFTIGANDASTTFAGSIANGAGGASALTAVTKTGTGTLTLTGPNTYSGATLISAGTLAIGDNTATGTLGSGTVTNNATLRFNRSDTALVVPNVIEGGGAIQLGVASGGSLGAETTLSGANTFTAGITIQSGGLRITRAEALGSGTKMLTMTNGTNGTPRIILAGSAVNIALPSSISFTTSNQNTTYPAIVNETGDNSIAGNISLMSGGGGTRIRVDAGMLTLTGQITPVVSGRVLFLDGTAPGIFSGALKNNGATTVALDKSGSGTWTLSGTGHTYTGTTTINAGKLVLSGPLASTIAVTGGSVAPQGTASTTGGVNVQSGGRFEVRPGTDTFTVGGSITLAGALDVIASPGLTIGATFTILNKTSAGAVSGTFIAKPQGSVFNASGYNWLISYTGGDGNDVTLSIATEQQAWRFTHFGTAANTGTAADTFDANGDGETNLLEFATGQNPNTGTLAITSVAKNGVNFEFTYTCAKAAVTDGATFAVEWSETLTAQSWTSVGAGTLLSDNGTLQTLKATVPFGAGTKRFLRLKITR